MRKRDTALDRRRFLLHSATLGLGSLIAPLVARTGWTASKDRLVIYQGVSLDSLHPYGYSGGGINGYLATPDRALDRRWTTRGNEYVGVLAESWEFQGRKWIFHLRKDIRFHNGAPFTSKDVAYSIEQIAKR